MNHTYIIAEAGVNHNGSIHTAKELIDVASEAGADAVKFQSFKADQMVSKYAEKAEYQKRSTEQSETQYEMLRKLELSEEDHFQLINYCEKRNIDFLSTPFDMDSVNLLIDQFQLKRVKVSSGDVTNAVLLLQIAQKNASVILSTGMSTIQDIKEALSVLAFGYMKKELPRSNTDFEEAFHSEEGKRLLKKHVSLLHCTTEYPAPISEVNLHALDLLSSEFQLPVGYSDHTEGITVPIAAVAKGATIIEKHFTLDRKLPGPDHKASLEPDELKQMVNAIRQIEMALGQPMKKPTPSEQKNMFSARKSLVAKRPIIKGERFSPENLTVKRPGGGIPPKYYWSFLGKVSNRNYEEDEVIVNE